MSLCVEKKKKNLCIWFVCHILQNFSVFATREESFLHEGEKEGISLEATLSDDDLVSWPNPCYTYTSWGPTPP